VQHLISTLFLFAIALPAQKAETRFDWQKRTTRIGYEALPVGEHSLAKLQVGAMWRLGASHDSATLLAMSPLLVGDAWIAPGHYRIRLRRDGETKCVLVPEGAELAVGAGSPIHMQGELGKPKQPAKKLAIELGKKGEAVVGNQPAELLVRFGDDEWRSELQILGHKTLTVTGGKLSAYSVPASRLEQGPVPIATLTIGKDGADTWNLILDKEVVRLVPWMAPPKTIDDAVEAPKGNTTEGKAVVLDVPVAAELPALEVREASLQKGELRVVVAFGSKVLECKLPDPRAKAGK
jgi:hypothetical protein